MHEDFLPENAYNPAPGWFWGAPTKGVEAFDLFYAAPVNVSRIVVLSGLASSNSTKLKQYSGLGKDFIRNGTIQISSSLKSAVTPLLQPTCANFRSLAGTFENGRLDMALEPQQVHCIRILIRPTTWIVIREIKVFNK